MLSREKSQVSGLSYTDRLIKLAEPDDTGFFERMGGEEKARAVTAMLGCLIEKDAISLRQYYWEEKTLAQIGGEMGGVSSNSIRLRLLRGKKRLKAQMNDFAKGKVPEVESPVQLSKEWEKMLLLRLFQAKDFSNQVEYLGRDVFWGVVAEIVGKDGASILCSRYQDEAAWSRIGGLIHRSPPVIRRMHDEAIGDIGTLIELPVEEVQSQLKAISETKKSLKEALRKQRFVYENVQEEKSSDLLTLIIGDCLKKIEKASTDLKNTQYHLNEAVTNLKGNPGVLQEGVKAHVTAGPGSHSVVVPLEELKRVLAKATSIDERERQNSATRVAVIFQGTTGYFEKGSAVIVYSPTNEVEGDPRVEYL